MSLGDATITPAALARAAELAEQLTDRAQSAGWDHRARTKDRATAVRNKTIGFAGEAAFAEWIGVPWEPDLNGFSKPDVAGYHIRTSRMADLLVRPHDVEANRDGIYVKVRQLEPLHYSVMGWLTPEEASVVVLLEDRGHYGAPAFWVPPALLHGMHVVPVTPELQQLRARLTAAAGQP